MYIGSQISCSGKVGGGFAMGCVQKFMPKLEQSKSVFSLASLLSSFISSGILYLEEFAAETWYQSPFEFCFVSAAIAS